jgi:membrane protein YdbS with pleckstrin-like domain
MNVLGGEGDEEDHQQRWPRTARSRALAGHLRELVVPVAGMRLITPGETTPTLVTKYLLPHEERVITVRKHPAVLFGPIALAVVGLILAALLSGVIGRHNGSALLVIWLAWLALLINLLFQALEWTHTYFVVTSQRMLQTGGLITRTVKMMPLVKVTDMSFQQSFQGRLLGYGQFILESAGQEQALSNVDYLPYPEQLYLEVCGLIFPGRLDEGDD